MAAAAVAHSDTTRMTIDVPARCHNPRKRVTAPITLTYLAHAAGVARDALPHRDPAHEPTTLRSRSGAAAPRRPRSPPRPRRPGARGAGSRPPDRPTRRLHRLPPPPRAAPPPPPAPPPRRRCAARGRRTPPATGCRG